MSEVTEALKQQRQEQGVIVPAAKSTSALAPINSGMGYLAKHASSGTVLRFSKDGKFVKPTEGDEEVPEGTQLAVIWDQARGGYQRFRGKGERPELKIGLVFGGKPPERDELGDNDEAQWPISDMTGKPEDPWREILMVPLQSIEDGAVYVFSTMSITGLRAVSNLLTQSARLAAKEPDHYPVFALRCGGYEHKKFGWVRVPAFERVGKTPKADITAALTSLADDMNDQVPW
jgi:hypothetical protein